MLVLLAAAPAGAEPGRTAAAFLQRPLSAAQAAMGSTGAALYGRAASVEYNPAANAFLGSREATASFLAAPAGGQFGLLAYGHPSPFGTLTGSLSYFNAGSVELSLTGGERRTVTAEEDLAAGAAYSVSPLPGLALGAGVRWLRLALAETARADAALADLGALWRGPGEWAGLSAGAALQNLGSDIAFESAGDPPPRTVRYGVAWQTGVFSSRRVDPGGEIPIDATLAADMVEVLREARSPRVGLELGLHPELMGRVALRFGWVFNRPAENLTVGFGVRRGRFLIDYALGSGELGPGHRFTLSAVF
ncbi:MAG: PorV/PorQ family protein [Elusimicrobia bacterium]|nr:PorV/PorQ family protein [Elusimicrobiota bacterium]